VVSAFDEAAFHFAPGWVRGEELLMRLRVQAVDVDLLINVHPFGSCHSLLVIKPAQRCPQVLDEDGLRAAFGLAKMSRRPDFKFGFNSLAACASVNHYHFQCLYFRGSGIELDTMPSEMAEVTALKGCSGVGELLGYPANGWRVTDRARGGLVCATATVAHVLQEHDVAHNVLLTSGQATVIPRIAQTCAADGVASGFAFVEMHGEMLVSVASAQEAQRLDREMTDEQVVRRIGAIGLGREQFVMLGAAIGTRIGQL
jgi:hypothetical protein